MRISDWSSDVCSSDLLGRLATRCGPQVLAGDRVEPQLAPERGDFIHRIAGDHAPRVALGRAVDLAKLAVVVLDHANYRADDVTLDQPIGRASGGESGFHAV